MRVINILIVLALALLVGHSMATICPFNSTTPSNYPQGNFLLSKQVAGTSTGSFIGTESTSYSDALTQNSYHSSTMAIGTTNFASELSMGPSLTSTKIIELQNGNLANDEEYGQVSMSRTNLTFCDFVVGGSSASISQGNFASQLALNAPIDMSYTAVMDGPNGYSTGFGSVFMKARSTEGTNSTVIDTQDLQQFYQWTGDFSFGVSDSLRITHPISRNYNKLVANLSQIQLC